MNAPLSGLVVMRAADAREKCKAHLDAHAAATKARREKMIEEEMAPRVLRRWSWRRFWFVDLTLTRTREEAIAGLKTPRGYFPSRWKEAEWPGSHGLNEIAEVFFATEKLPDDDEALISTRILANIAHLIPSHRRESQPRKEKDR